MIVLLLYFASQKAGVACVAFYRPTSPNLSPRALEWDSHNGWVRYIHQKMAAWRESESIDCTAKADAYLDTTK